MTADERHFLEDIKEAVSDYDYSYEYYHETTYGTRYFCVDITVSEEDWELSDMQIWNALSDVRDEWDAGIDQHHTCYQLALEL